MAEMIVRVVDKQKSDDPYVDAQRFQKGDVLGVVPDGWEWTKAERENPEWMIVQVPNVARDQFTMLLNQEPGDKVANRMLRLRSHCLDVDAIKAGTKDVQSAILAKPALPDPNVIG